MTLVSAPSFKALGFRTSADPGAEFAEPPGILSLDCMAYYAKTYPDEFRKHVAEQRAKADAYACPFAAISVRLVDLLLALLNVGKPRACLPLPLLPFLSCVS